MWEKGKKYYFYVRADAGLAGTELRQMTEKEETKNKKLVIGWRVTTAQLMILDSMTNKVIAAAESDYAAGFGERFSKWDSAEDAFKYWGKRLREFIDEVAAAK